jgi:hypothetical protein
MSSITDVRQRGHLDNAIGLLAASFILTAAASLTSSLQSTRAATVALWVAMASLAVAARTLLVTQAAEHQRRRGSREVSSDASRQ